MGEIKSTLEIIMEKTKGLTMSDEERAAYKEQEASKKIKGLIQKHADGAIDAETVKMELITLERESPDKVRRMLLEEIIPRIEVEEDNEAIFELLEKVLRLDIRPMRKALEETRQSLEAKRLSLEKAMLERLEEKGVSGSGVFPNIRGDKGWVHQVEGAKEDLRKKLEILLESSG